MAAAAPLLSLVVPRATPFQVASGASYLDIRIPPTHTFVSATSIPRAEPPCVPVEGTRNALSPLSHSQPGESGSFVPLSELGVLLVDSSRLSEKALFVWVLVPTHYVQ